jgi:hypothetical protein
VVLFDPVFLKARAGEAAALLLDMSARGYPVLEAVAGLDLSDVYKAFRAHEGSDEGAATATQLIVQPLVAAMRRLVSSDDQLPTTETEVQGEGNAMTVARDLTVSVAGVRVEASSTSTSPRGGIAASQTTHGADGVEGEGEGDAEAEGLRIDFSQEEIASFNLMALVDPAEITRPSKHLQWSVSRKGLQDADRKHGHKQHRDYSLGHGRGLKVDRTTKSGGRGHDKLGCNESGGKDGQSRKEAKKSGRRPMHGGSGARGGGGRIAASQSGLESESLSLSQPVGAVSTVDTRTDLLEENLRQMERNAPVSHRGPSLRILKKGRRYGGGDVDGPTKTEAGCV